MNEKKLNNDNNKKKKIKRIISKIVIAIIVIISVSFLIYFPSLLVTHTYEEHNMDLEKEYREYLKYSLGDYHFNYRTVESDHSWGPFNHETTRYREYTFYYNDINEEFRSVELSNYNNCKYVEKDIIEETENMLSEQIRNYLFSLTESELKEKGNYGYFYDVDVNTDRNDSSIPISDPNKGLKLKDISFNNLGQNNLNISVSIEMSMYSWNNDKDKLEIIKNKIINAVKDFILNADYNNIKEITMIFSKLENNENGYNYYDGFEKYSVSYDGKNVIVELVDSKK